MSCARFSTEQRRLVWKVLNYLDQQPNEKTDCVTEEIGTSEERVSARKGRMMTDKYNNRKR